jgi:hypothetical protein
MTPNGTADEAVHLFRAPVILFVEKSTMSRILLCNHRKRRVRHIQPLLMNISDMGGSSDLRRIS